MNLHLVAFLKDPAPGAAKTRLHGRLTPHQAARLSRVFILDTLDVLSRVPAACRVACYAPPGAENGVRALCGGGWTLRPQSGRDLGERMHRAFAECFRQGASAVVLTGTDIPTLPLHHLHQAVRLLRSNQVVLGPSADGGYYLLGLRRPAPFLFRGIDWSTPRVFSQTVRKVESSGFSLGLLPPWYDVDTPEDLDLLSAHGRALSRSGKPFPRRTLACLASF